MPSAGFVASLVIILAIPIYSVKENLRRTDGTAPRGVTATFVGLLNRLTSLLAGVIATVVYAVAFDSAYPDSRQWSSVGLIVVAFWLLTRAERRRGTPRAA